MILLHSNQRYYQFFFLWYETLLSFWLFTLENNVAVGNQIFILYSEIKCLQFPIQIQCFTLNTVLMWSQKEIKCGQNWSERWSPKVDLRRRRKTQNSLSNLIRFSGYIYLFAVEIKRCRSSPAKALLHTGGLQLVIISRLFYKGTCYYSPYMQRLPLASIPGTLCQLEKMETQYLKWEEPVIPISKNCLKLLRRTSALIFYFLFHFMQKFFISCKSSSLTFHIYFIGMLARSFIDKRTYRILQSCSPQLGQHYVTFGCLQQFSLSGKKR